MFAIATIYLAKTSSAEPHLQACRAKDLHAGRLQYCAPCLDMQHQENELPLAHQVTFWYGPDLVEWLAVKNGANDLLITGWHDSMVCDVHIKRNVLPAGTWIGN